jgi:ABC-type glycerol-3-phosphate transport system substrate-binding protein
MRLCRISTIVLVVLMITLVLSTLVEAKTLKVWVQADAVRYPGFEAVTKKFEEENPRI